MHGTKSLKLVLGVCVNSSESSDIVKRRFPRTHWSNFLNEFIRHNWVSSLTTFVMHISAPIPEFSVSFCHTTVAHNIITVYTTQSTMNLGRALSLCVKKTNHSTYLAAGGSVDDSAHVSSVITPTLRSESVWGQAFSENKCYLLLLSVGFGAMTTLFFSPTNRRLILELPSYFRHGFPWAWSNTMRCMRQWQHSSIT